MINVFKAQNVNFLSGDEKITRRSGLKNKMFLGGNFFRLAQLGQIGAHQRLSERRRYRVNSLSQVFIVDYEKPAEAGFSGWKDYATFSSEQLHTGIGKGWPFLA